MTESKPTHEEIIAAHEALEKLCDRLPATRSAKESILRALPPKPQLTMAEVEWDDDKHYLAEAKHMHSGRVIMLAQVDDSAIKCLKKDNGYTFTACSDFLKPTGKRYTLTEV